MANNDIGDRIKSIRMARGLTQVELGRRCGMTDSAIRRYESGRGNPTAETVNRIAKALEVPPGNLLGFYSVKGHDNLEEKLHNVGWHIGYDEDNASVFLGCPEGFMEVSESDLVALQLKSDSYMRYLLEEQKNDGAHRFYYRKPDQKEDD